MGGGRGGRRETPAGAPLRVEPDTADHARLHHHRHRGLHRLRVSSDRAEPRPYLDGPAAQPNPDPGLQLGVCADLSASGFDADVESGGGGRLLRGSAVPGLSAAGGALWPHVASGPAVNRPRRPGRGESALVGGAAHHGLATRRGRPVAAALPGVVRRRHGAGGPSRHERTVFWVPGAATGRSQLSDRVHADCRPGE